MYFELRQLSLSDGQEIYNLLQKIPAEENGFLNGCNGKDFGAYKPWLQRQMNMSHGIGLEDWMVPSTTYWLFVDGNPVGMGKIRHYLTDKLRVEGGHVGYAVCPSERGKGYGKLLVKCLIQEAKKLNISQLLITVRNHNVASIKAAISNGGIIERSDDLRHYILVNC